VDAPCLSCYYHFRPSRCDPCFDCAYTDNFDLYEPANTQEVEMIEDFDRYTTGIKQKRENFSTFATLIENQFKHGGDKYATKPDAEKEFTDLICEAFPGDSGIDWVLGTAMKYLGRDKNFGREKDLLKIATYMYLLWLKGGFHLKEDHDEDVKKEG